MSSQEQEQKLKGGFEVYLLVDQLGPEDLAVRAEAEQQPGGDLLGEPRAVPPEERRGVRAQLRGPVHTVDGLADQVPEGDQPVMIDNHQSPLNEGQSDSVEGGSVKPNVPSKKKRKLREKWVFPRVTAIIVLSPLINSGADKK